MPDIRAVLTLDAANAEMTQARLEKQKTKKKKRTKACSLVHEGLRDIFFLFSSFTALLGELTDISRGSMRPKAKGIDNFPRSLIGAEAPVGCREFPLHILLAFMSGRRETKRQHRFRA